MNKMRGLVLRDFKSANNFNTLSPLGPTYWPYYTYKNLDIIDILLPKFPWKINLLDLNLDHSLVLLILDIVLPAYPIPPTLFYTTTDWLKFHNLVNQEIKLNIRLKSTYDID